MIYLPETYYSCLMGRGWVSFGSWIFIFHVFLCDIGTSASSIFLAYNCDFIIYIRRCLQIISIGVSKIHSLPRPRRGLRGIVFTRSVCLSVCVCVCVCVCVRPIFWYFISRLLEEISISNLYRTLIGCDSIH